MLVPARSTVDMQHLSDVLSECSDRFAVLVRERLNMDVCVTSAFRSPEYNKTVGGVAGSAHCSGNAIDVACTKAVRFKMLKSAMDAGFRQIGIYAKYLHLECSLDKEFRVWYG